MLRLATVNIASGRDIDGAVRLERVGQSLAGLAADVVALQEVDRLLPRSGGVDQAAVLGAACAGGGDPWHTTFAAALHGTPGPGGDARPAGSSLPDVPSYGVALLSRHAVVATRELRLAPARGRRPIPLPPGTRPPVWFIADEQRVALATTLRTPDGDLTVVTTHLSFAPGRAVLQLRRIRAWAADLPRPLVVMGDLNLPGPVPRRVTGWTSLVQSPTFPAHRPRLQLDHVLADGMPWTVGSAGSVVVGGSDHRGVVVDLEQR
ncbi:MAG: endonuclease/exonuclease/phosphatase family protein [Aeromicrobium sp.]